MTKIDRLRFDMFIRVGQFLKDNTADFPANSVVATQAAVLATVINSIQTRTGEQTSGLNGARFHHSNKATARENLREMLVDISATARSMVYRIPAIDLKFRHPHGTGNVELLAQARSFLAEATPLKQEFIAYRMEEDFLTELQALIEEFEASLNSAVTATGAHIEATADIGEEVRRGMIAVRTMDAVVKNTYRRDLSKLVAWKSASHIERLPRSSVTSANPSST